MEAIRFIQRVESGRAVIDNLEKFTGKKVEIIVVPLDDSEKKTHRIPAKSARGCLKKYANSELINKEKMAWTMAIKENNRLFQYRNKR